MQFLKQLTTLFESTKDKGTIWLTHKRCASTCSSFFQRLTVAHVVTHDGEDATMGDADPDGEKEYPCLIRVTDGKKSNFSTHVGPLFSSTLQLILIPTAIDSSSPVLHAS